MNIGISIYSFSCKAKFGKEAKFYTSNAHLFFCMAVQPRSWLHIKREAWELLRILPLKEIQLYLCFHICIWQYKNRTKIQKIYARNCCFRKDCTSGFLPTASGRRCLLTTSLHMIWSTFLTNGPDCTLLCFLLSFWCQHFPSLGTLQLKTKFKFP